MCRFVLVVIFVSCVSNVLAATDKPVPENPCKKDPEVLNARQAVRVCFNQTVAHHLNPADPPSTEKCTTVAEFGVKLNTYMKTVAEKCNFNLTLNATNLIKLIDYSLNNESFKEFYNDVECLKKAEYNISNFCVKGKVGFFNISATSKHTSWPTKTVLQYSRATCDKSIKVDECVKVNLNSCKIPTGEYVANLFKYARDLGSCHLFPNTTAIPPADGTDAAATSWLTTPVIITLSVGAVVVVGAIIIFVVLKCKDK